MVERLSAEARRAALVKLKGWSEEQWANAFVAHSCGQMTSWLGQMPEGLGGEDFYA